MSRRALVPGVVPIEVVKVVGIEEENVEGNEIGGIVGIVSLIVQLGP
jgi:hypothetical protein